MGVPQNRFKHALAERRLQIGLWSQLSSNIGAEVLARAGFDWIVIDTEHAPNELPGVLAQLQALAISDAAPVVRLAWNDQVLTKRMLDIGAQTLLIPFVETESDARRAVLHTRYPPQGVRGVASNHRANHFGRITDYLTAAAAEICVLVQIETATGVENLEAIAAVEGVDGIFVGPSDLAASLGHIGNAAHPDVEAAIVAVHRLATRAGKPTGILAPIDADARRYIEMGFTFVAVGNDLSLLARNAEALAGRFGPESRPSGAAPQQPADEHRSRQADLRLPHVKAPPGACDTHIHIYGPPEIYKLAPTSPSPPPFAPVKAFREVMRRLGTERSVVVQPAAYGKDNSCTLDAVRELGIDRTRAVVVVDETVTDAELDRLTKAGARAVRFHMLKGGVLGWDIIEQMAERVKAFGWHIQLQLDGRLLPEKRATIEGLQATVVIDHTGKFLEPVPPDHEAFKVLLDLVDTGRFWVKLSAPYETSKAGPPDYADVGVLAKELIKRAPERMLWASNWPHPGAQPNPPDDAMLLDVLGHWCPDETVRNRILADNPASLYGFA